MFGVLVLAGTLGGRSERLCALLLGGSWAVREALARAGLGPALGEGAALADSAVLLALAWLLWRDRPPWLWTVTALQALRTGVGAALPEQLGSPVWLTLAGLQATCLTAALLRRRFGPPYRLPESGRVEHAR